ncbi:hypothetical protein PACILC2_37320 [Paenibacillus cisolokensis]|uniref:Uncharacterized protein n=1 Tax=Paenibacillus cisolokensis TaxID=1658519 RepID=A0ABQ4NB65_9BACL|nr:hypothetical protein [Paenibacillus cisolokensis]GIQ65164.1 hypothetical protein PACILC2_37320 [Paenibacillus cisolokensis]
MLALLVVFSIFPQTAMGASFNEGDLSNNHVTVTDSVYDIYATLGTLPTLYAGLNAFHSDHESYMWFHRKATFNPSALPENVNLIAFEHTYNRTVMDELIGKVADIYSENPNAQFNFYVDDLRVQFILQMFVANGLPESQYKVYLLSDGTGSYSIFKSLFEQENSFVSWETYKNEYENRKTLIQAGETDVINTDNNTELQKSMYYVSQYPNVQYWMQFPELLRSNDPRVAEEIKKMNVVKKCPMICLLHCRTKRKRNLLKPLA